MLEVVWGVCSGFVWGVCLGFCSKFAWGVCSGFFGGFVRVFFGLFRSFWNFLGGLRIVLLEGFLLVELMVAGKITWLFRMRSLCSVVCKK